MEQIQEGRARTSDKMSGQSFVFRAVHKAVETLYIFFDFLISILLLG